MQVPLEISLRGVQEAENIKELIREKVAKLERTCDYMIRCRVAVERPHQHQRSGNPFRVRIEMTVPHGHELVVKRESGEGDMHQTLPAVLRNAFDAARRQLKELVERQRGLVKTHPETKATAFVSELYQDEGYGFVKTEDEREIYFHQNSVVNDEFHRLRVGNVVRVVEEEGDKGPRARLVQVIDKTGTRVPVSEEEPQPESPAQG